MLRLLCVAAVLAAAGCQVRPAAMARPGTALARQLAQRAATAPIPVAHRGASADFPENTVPAFRAAAAAGAPVIELDFHQTADGVLVALHDETLDRTTDSEVVFGRAKVEVASVALAQLASLDAGAWKNAAFAGTRIPTLEQALGVIAGRACAMIEHKAGDAAVLVALLRRLDLVDAVLVQSFDWNWLAELHRLEPRITIAALGSGPALREQLEALPPTGACMVHWAAKSLTVEDLIALRRRGYLTCAYTIDDDLGWVGAAALGLDAITTNRPARLTALLARGVVRRRAEP